MQGAPAGLCVEVAVGVQQPRTRATLVLLCAVAGRGACALESPYVEVPSAQSCSVVAAAVVGCPCVLGRRAGSVVGSLRGMPCFLPRWEALPACLHRTGLQKTEQGNGCPPAVASVVTKCPGVGLRGRKQIRALGSLRRWHPGWVSVLTVGDGGRQTRLFPMTLVALWKVAVLLWGLGSLMSIRLYREGGVSGCAAGVFVCAPAPGSVSGQAVSLHILDAGFTGQVCVPGRSRPPPTCSQLGPVG